MPPGVVHCEGPRARLACQNTANDGLWPPANVMPLSSMLHCCKALLQVGKKAKEAGAAASAASKKAGRAAKAAARDPQVSNLSPTPAEDLVSSCTHSWGGTSDNRPPQTA